MSCLGRGGGGGNTVYRWIQPGQLGGRPGHSGSRPSSYYPQWGSPGTQHHVPVFSCWGDREPRLKIIYMRSTTRLVAGLPIPDGPSHFLLFLNRARGSLGESSRSSRAYCLLLVSGSFIILRFPHLPVTCPIVPEDMCKTSVSRQPACPSTRPDRRGLHKPYCGPNNGGDNLTTQHVKRIDQLGPIINIGRRSIPTDSVEHHVCPAHHHSHPLPDLQYCVTRKSLQQAWVLESRSRLQPHIYLPRWAVYTWEVYTASPFRLSPFNKLKNCFPAPVQPTTPHTRVPAYESSPDATCRYHRGRVPASRSKELGPWGFCPSHSYPKVRLCDKSRSHSQTQNTVPHSGSRTDTSTPILRDDTRVLFILYAAVVVIPWSSGPHPRADKCSPLTTSRQYPHGIHNETGPVIQIVYP